MFFLKNVVEISKHCIHYFFIGQLLCLIYAARYDVDITSSKYKECLHCDVLIFTLSEFWPPHFAFSDGSVFAFCIGFIIIKCFLIYEA
jgi:hypothetical protein